MGVKKVSMFGKNLGPRGSNIAPDKISARQQANSPKHSHKHGRSMNKMDHSKPVKKFC